MNLLERNLLDHAVVYGMQYLFLLVFGYSEVRYLMQHTSHKPIHKRSVASVLCMVFAVVLSIAGSIFHAQELGDDAVDVRNGMALTSAMECFAMVFTLVIEVLRAWRDGDHVFLYPFWALRCLGLVLDITFEGPNLFKLLHIACGVVYLVMCYIRQRWHSADSFSNPAVQPNFIRHCTFSWMDETYREAHQQSAAFYDGNLPDVLPQSYKCKALLEKTENFATRQGYTPVHDGTTDDIRQEMRPFTICNLLLTFWKKILVSGLIRLSLILLYFACPYLMKALIEENQTLLVKKWMVSALFHASVLIALLNTQYLNITLLTGHKMEPLLMDVIYQSELTYDGATKPSSNMLTGVATSLKDLVQHCHMMWSGLIIIVVTFVCLGWTIGFWSSGFGLFIMGISIYVIRKLDKKVYGLKKHVNRLKDDRVACLTSAIEHMRQIKSDQLEQFVVDEVDEIRREERRHMLTTLRYDEVKYLIGVVMPTILPYVTFFFMYFVGSGTLLTVQTLFVTLALFNIVRYPMSACAAALTYCSNAKAMLGHVNEFLCSKRKQQRVARIRVGETTSTNQRESFGKMQEVCSSMVNQLDVRRDELLHAEGAEISIRDTVILRDVNLRLRKGTLTLLTGTHGSGKTTLLRAMIDATDRTAGKWTVSWTRKSYCPQTWCLISGTIRSNILMGEEYVKERYDKVIEACCLDEDFKSFPDGDERVVGEGGHSLSGGQARRMSLARAVYREADVYVFDDPLRSLDPNVARMVFKRIFDRTDGLLARRSCVVASHNPDFLGVADTILVVSEGTVKRCDRSAMEHGNQPNEDGPAHGEPEHAVQGELRQKTKRPKKPVTEHDRKNPDNVSHRLYLAYVGMFHWAWFLGIVVLEGVATSLSIYVTLLLTEWVSEELRVNWKFCAIILCLLLWITMVALNMHILLRRGLKVAGSIHSSMLTRILHQWMTFFDQHDSGVIMNRFSNDVHTMDMFFVKIRGVLKFFFAIVGTLGLFAVKLLDELWLFIGVLAAVTLLILGLLGLQRYHIKVARNLKRFEAGSFSPLILQYNETVQAIDTIRAHDAEDWFHEQFQTKIDKRMNYTLYNVAAGRWVGVRLELIGTVVIYFVSLLTVRYESMIGYTFMAIIISYVLALIPSLNNLFAQANGLEDSIISFERAQEYLVLDVESLNEGAQDYPNDNEGTGPAKGPIEFRNVTLTFNGNATVLHNINLTIVAGEKLGIVGRTGSGKSSLVSTLQLLYPKQITGNILVAGVDVKDIAIAKLRGALTVVPQSTRMFRAKVKNFIDPRNESTEQRLIETLRECGLENALLNTSLQDLSVGQCQLLCLARGLLRDSPVIILDEATSALDRETEDLILQVLHEKFRDRTVLTIAHHLNTVESCDRILWMQDGRVRKLAPLADYTAEERNELGFRD